MIAFFFILSWSKSIQLLQNVNESSLKTNNLKKIQSFAHSRFF
jgi:hypothetical protein